MNILPAIKELLSTDVDGNGNVFTDRIFMNRNPDGFIDYMVIRDTGEIEPDADATFSTEIENRTFQILLFGKQYDPTAGRAELIRAKLHLRPKTVVGGFVFLNMLMFTGFQPLDETDTGGYVFSGNFKCRVRRAAESDYEQ